MVKPEIGTTLSATDNHILPSSNGVFYIVRIMILEKSTSLYFSEISHIRQGRHFTDFKEGANVPQVYKNH
jgi:hypothetical protein